MLRGEPKYPETELSESAQFVVRRWSPDHFHQ
jgi:hypothetical protein